MSITKAGPICDVCEKLILPFLSEMQLFSVTGIEQTLHCHDKCTPLVKEMVEKKDWKMLPEGPLRRCFAEHYKPSEGV